MSIVSLRYRNEQTRIRWLLGLFFLALAAAWLAASCAIADDNLVQPNDYVIVSDEAEESGGEDRHAPADDPPGDSSADEEPAPKPETPSELPAEEDGATQESEGDDFSADGKSKTDREETGEESTAEEVAPIHEPGSDVPPPVDADAEAEAGSVNHDAATARPAVEGASFKGVVPGITTVDELEKAWGPATQVRKDGTGTQHVHHMKPFKDVVATVVDGKVDTIVLRLEKLVEPSVLVGQLNLEDVEPATIFNAKGQMLGMAFPERGVLFGFAPGTPVQVAQIVIEPINAQPFVTRAEKNWQKRPAEALLDLEYAIEIDPDYDRAHAIQANVFCELGQFDKALASSERALALSPNDAEHRLTHAKILLHQQDFKQAAAVAEKLAGEEKIPALVRAHAQMVWGDALALGQSRAFDQAIQHHTLAIRFAEQTSKKTAGPVRRAARELLMDAHLAIAHDIAWGNWQQKPKVVPKWIDRATAFCDSVIKKDLAGEALRLRVYQQTLHAFAGTKGAPDLTETIDAMNALGRALMADEPSSSRRQMLAWQLGEAMASAMLIAQNQSNPDAATQFGQQALAYFEQSGKVGESWPGRDQTVGKVYYRLGVVQAIDKEEHRKAVAWYDKAVPLLEASAPPSAAGEGGRLGEMFVSMAVSYWESSKRDEAVRLTQQGAKLMEVAVADQAFSKDALAVPYGNLSSMHAKLGNSKQSKQFAEMAAKTGNLLR